jgi:hypothetical protein
MVPMAGLLAIAGVGLDLTINYTVVNMASGISGFTGINIAWKLIRDLMNIIFIFLLVYEAIKLILSQSTTQSIFKFIGFLVLAALLVNFSLFFTKIMIDASNIVTIGIYNSILNSAPINIPIPGYPVQVTGISIPFMSNLGLTSIFSTSASSLFGGGTNAMIATLFGAALFLIASFVFFAVSLVFIIRYVTLIILLMISPIGFMGSALPFVSDYSKQWWKALNSQLIFAPVYMLMTWLVLTLMSSPNFLITTGDWAAGGQGSFSFMLNYVIVITLVIATLFVAKSTSSKGSGYISDATKRLSGFAGGLVMGGVARTGRNTLGRWGANVAENEDLKRQATEGNWRQRTLAKAQLSLGNRAAESTFDTRATERFGAIAKATGFGKDDFGKVDKKKETYKAIVEAQNKRAEDVAKFYKPSDAAAEAAKNKLNLNTKEGLEFNVAEQKRKADYITFMKSPEYLNSAEYKAKKALNEETKALVTDNKNVEDELETNQKDLTGVDRSIDSINNKGKQIDTLIAKSNKTPEETKLLDDLRKSYVEEQSQLSNLIDQRKMIVNRITENQSKKVGLQLKMNDIAKKMKEMEFDEKSWMSDEKKSLIATAGGTTTEKSKGNNPITTIKDAAGNIVGKIDSKGVVLEGANVEVKSAFVQRVEREAKNIESRGIIGRFIDNTVGAAANTVGISSMPLTKKNRQEMARRARKVTEGKKKPTKEELKKIGFEVADDEPEDDATPAAPPAAAPAATNPTPGNP